MNLFAIIELTRSRINRSVSSEAKQKLWQALLGLKKVASESLVQLLFRLIVRDAIRDVLEHLIKALIE
jgi:ribosomal protein L30/L7E